jgi:hypothetical protein
MHSGWQDSWTFRVVDQDSGAAVPGVPVTVLDDGGRSAGVWVSDVDGLVRIPKHDGPRLRLRVGLRSDDVIELSARSLPGDPVALIAPRPSGGAPSPGAPAPEEPSSQPGSSGRTHPGHIERFMRIGVLPQDGDLCGAGPDAADAMTIRYAMVLEVEQVWQSHGSAAGDTLYSVSLGPGDELKVAIQDGRWRKKPDSRERPLQIVAKMVATKQVGDGLDAAPLEAFVVTDVPAAAAETVRYLTRRTVRATESLRRRPLGVTEFEGEKPAGAAVRTVRNLRSDGVLTYHFVEPVERWRVIVRTPRPRPVILVPFRLPNIATRDVVRRFGHTIRRAILDRAFIPDVDQVLAQGEPAPAAEERLYAHMLAHLSYYSATIIAAGDPAERFFALAKLRDPRGRVLTDVIANVVVGRVGNYVAFPLRSLEETTPEWRAALEAPELGHLRLFQEVTVTLPLPGVWLRAQLSPALLESDAAAEEPADDAEAADRRTVARPRPRG